MLRSALKARILDGINDDPSAPVIFSDTQLDDLIEEGAEIVCQESKAIRRSVVVPLRAGYTFYSTPSVAPDVMFPYRIWNQTLSSRLAATSMQELDDFHERWITVQRSPELWFPVSWDQFGIWPGVAEPGGLLRVDYLAWPRGLLDDTDESELTRPTQDALVLYGRYIGLLKQWDAELAASVFQEFQGQTIFANARSNILRIAHRDFRRSNLDLPSSIRTEY